MTNTLLEEKVIKLYQEDPKAFLLAIKKIKTNPSPITQSDWIHVVAIAALTSFLILIPSIFGWGRVWDHQDNPAFQNLINKFYSFGVSIFAAIGWWLTLRISNKKFGRYDITFVAVTVILSLYALLAPFSTSSSGRHDTVATSALAYPIILFLTISYYHLKDKFWDPIARSRFLQHFFDSLLQIGFIEIGGIILTGFTIALFSNIFDYHFQEWYFTWVVPAGAISAVTFGVYLATHTDSLKNLTSILARIFTPLFLLTLVTYLIISLISGKNPYADREFLVTCNIILVVVMGLIHLSLNTESGLHRFHHILMTGLLAMTGLINSIALVAIVMRLTSYGFTPNRIVILGTNFLVFIHLIRLLVAKLDFLRGKSTAQTIMIHLTDYWPIYGIWAVFVALILPFIFHFQ